MLVKVDMRNAFNSISRDLMLNIVKRVCPSVLPFLNAVYHSPILLVAANCESSFLMQEGGAQGDPSMPALFCFALSAIVSHCGKLPEGVLLPKYIDDMHICIPSPGLLGDVMLWLDSFSSTAAKFGLVLNENKTTLIARSDDIISVSWPGMRVNVDTDCAELLGVPYSDISVCARDKLRSILSAVSCNLDKF